MFIFIVIISSAILLIFDGMLNTVLVEQMAIRITKPLATEFVIIHYDIIYMGVIYLLIFILLSLSLIISFSRLKKIKPINIIRNTK